MGVGVSRASATSGGVELLLVIGRSSGSALFAVSGDLLHAREENKAMDVIRIVTPDKLKVLSGKLVRITLLGMCSMIEWTGHAGPPNLMFRHVTKNSKSLLADSFVS